MNKRKLLFSATLMLSLFAKAQTPLGTDNVQAISIAVNTALTTPYIVPPNVSGVINDPTDPAQNYGIVVNVLNGSTPITAANYTLTAASSKTSVVANADITITQSDGYATVKIKPKAVGYSTITLTLTSGGSSKTYKVSYAASASAVDPIHTFWHTGYSDASGCVALDSNYMVMCDDEMNYLFVTARNQSGMYVKKYYYGDSVGLTDGSKGNYKETDAEACVRSTAYPNRVYWTGSMGSDAGDNASCLFATNMSGTGANTNFSLVGHYNSLRKNLVTWGDAHSYNFTSSAASSHDSKTIDGFNVEGITIGPDNTTLYIGFRAPLVPTSNRKKALIAPLLNFESWFNNGNPSGTPTFGAPIELDLGGRGFRDIVRMSDGTYIIVAGNYAGNPLTGAVFQWSGNAADAPIQIPQFDISALNAESVLEIDKNGQMQKDRLEILSDNGSYEFYNDGNEAKDLGDDEFKKYRGDILIAPSNVVPVHIQSFTATQQNNAAVLNWVIGNTDDAKTFEIMRSTNGKDFSSIATENFVAGKTAYSYTDANIDGTVYYKVKIMDESNAVFYTTVADLNFNSANVIKLYPNPINNNSFTISNNAISAKQIKIYDLKGALVKSITSYNPSVDIDAANWSRGTYIVEVTDATNKLLLKQAVVK
ncbi:T9SS type A sorting domain-containing protein [Ferruginibacter albus]|uniref:T9SS type A sorting domain-containing protein n=1 Tax=Ferruginibacter albus TaxID=2875540 RepID=UPI001CC82055|nr:T9SS type A sorting domain-containing protein [Ferruginibacter albus]UAY53523.1 T9SS type A sorting domain-containing protein [Ferruginibacter albus]